jgi:hypothetical protein
MYSIGFNQEQIQTQYRADANSDNAQSYQSLIKTGFLENTQKLRKTAHFKVAKITSVHRTSFIFQFQFCSPFSMHVLSTISFRGDFPNPIYVPLMIDSISQCLLVPVCFYASFAQTSHSNCTFYL